MKPEDKAKVRQALEFLEMISPQFPPLVYTETDRKRDEASTALRQLLERTEQEPVAWHDKIMGMEVSMDVSTGDDDIDHRVYGTVYEVIFQDGGGTPDVILAIETERNFTTPPAAQPAPVQEPDEWLTGCPECGMDSGCDCDSGTCNPPAQPADHADELTIAYMSGVYDGKQIAKREWVGLTDDEFNELYDAYEKSNGIGALMQRVEAKLREKNGGGA